MCKVWTCSSSCVALCVRNLWSFENYVSLNGIKHSGTFLLSIFVFWLNGEDSSSNYANDLDKPKFVQNSCEPRLSCDPLSIYSKSEVQHTGS